MQCKISGKFKALRISPRPDGSSYVTAGDNQQYTKVVFKFAALPATIQLEREFELNDAPCRVISGKFGQVYLVDNSKS